LTVPPHSPASYGFVRPPLPQTGAALLSDIQTPADFEKTENVYIEADEREQTMMTRIQKTAPGRVNNDPRINLMGERVDRVWADPILNPRKDIVR
jgi:hypothetical protein